ncbi:MAG TPA: hypothetical protein VIT00_10765, partial [Terrimicrobiaceae bacterium]
MKKSIVNSSSAAGVIRIVALAVLLGFVPFVLDSQAQESPAPADQAASEQAAGQQPAAPKHKDKTFMEVLREGGIVMIPLAAVSVYMLTLIIDSVRRIQNKVVCPP